MSEVDLDSAAELAAQLRVDSIRASTSAGSGHPTSSMCAADLLAVLVARHLRYEWDDPGSPDNDHLIFSKGHATPLAAYARRAEAFGARTLAIDGHDLAAIDDALATAADTTDGRPTVILARTVKGRGFSEVEDRPDWHGKQFPAEMAERAIAALGGARNLLLRGPGPAPAAEHEMEAAAPDADAPLPRYAVGETVATRRAYGDALVVLGARDAHVVVVDAEVSNSTYANEFARAYPKRYFEMFIAEQQLADSLLADRPTSLSLAHMAVREMPGSGSGEQLLAWAGIDADHIAAAARRLLERATAVPA